MDLLTDELLAAYADGELSRKDARLVEAELKRSPDAQRRLAAFNKVSALLLEAHRPAEHTLRPAVGSGFPQRFLPAGIGRAGLAFACVAGLAWVCSDPAGTGSEVFRPRAPLEAAGWAEPAAMRAGGAETAGHAAMAAWLGEQLGAPIRVPHLPGWSFSGSRTVKSGVAPAVALAYTAPDGRDFELRVTASGQEDRPLAFQTAGGLGLARWGQQGYALEIVGRLSAGEAGQLSRFLQENAGSWIGRPGTQDDGRPGVRNGLVHAAPSR